MHGEKDGVSPGVTWRYNIGNVVITVSMGMFTSIESDTQQMIILWKFQLNVDLK